MDRKTNTMDLIERAGLGGPPCLRCLPFLSNTMEWCTFDDVTSSRCRRCRAQHRNCVPVKHTDKVDRFISLRGAIFYLGKLGRIDSELNLELRQLVEDLRRPMVEAKSKRGRDAALAGVKKRKLADEIDMTAPQMKKACAKRQNAEKVASEDVHRTEVKDEREDERGHDIKVGALRRPKSTKNQEKSSSDSESESEDDNIKSYILGSGTRCEKHFNSYSDSSEDEHSVSAHNQESKSAPVPPKTGYQQDFVLSDQSQSESESESQNEASDSDSDSGSD